MRIVLTSVTVNDQAKALAFYTDVLGFVKKADMPAGEYRWLTVVSPEAPDSVELLLEPNANPASQVFQKAIFDQGIPATSFASRDVQADYDRMTKLGVVFRQPPTKSDWGTTAMFEDTCGNLIQIHQG